MMEHPGHVPKSRHRAHGHPEERRDLVSERRRQARRSRTNTENPHAGVTIAPMGAAYCILSRRGNGRAVAVVEPASLQQRV